MNKVITVPELPKEQWPASFEEACERKGYDAEAIVKAFSLLPLPELMRKALLAETKLIVIIEVLNNGWVPDWTNGLWDKYIVWFRMGSPSGDGFSYYDYDYWRTASGVGSRLVLRKPELAKYMGRQFEGLYKEYMVLEAGATANAVSDGTV